MWTAKVKLIAAFGIFAALACRNESSGSVRNDAPAGFVAIAAPDSGSATAYCAAQTAVDWTPFVGPDSVTIHIGPAIRQANWPFASDSVVSPEGRLVAYDQGEFGGGVVWRSAGARDSVTVWASNVMQLVPWQDTVFAIGGLSHMATNYGTIVRLWRRNGMWQADSVIDLGASPWAVRRVSDDSVLVLTTRDLQVIDLRKITQEIVHAREAWPLAYPGSVVRDNAGRFYVGLRYGVARIDVRGETTQEEWLVPSSCPGFRITSGNTRERTAICQCLPPAA